MEKFGLIFVALLRKKCLFEPATLAFENSFFVKGSNTPVLHTGNKYFFFI